MRKVGLKFFMCYVYNKISRNAKFIKILDQSCRQWQSSDLVYTKDQLNLQDLKNRDKITSKRKEKGENQARTVVYTCGLRTLESEVEVYQFAICYYLHSKSEVPLGSKTCPCLQKKNIKRMEKLIKTYIKKVLWVVQKHLFTLSLLYW